MAATEEAVLRAFDKFWNTDESRALQLLSQLPNPAAVRDYFNWSLLHHACWNGWYEVTKALVENYRCDPSCRNDFGATPLHFACRRGNLVMVRALIEQYHCDPSCRNVNGATPLHFACRGKLDIVRFLTEQCHCDPSCRDTDGGTPLQWACFNGHLDVVKYLILEQKCNPLQPNNSLGDTPLDDAIYSGYTNVVSFLLFSGEVRKLFSSQLGSEEEGRKLLDHVAKCRKGKPFQPAFKVFVMGNPDAGKSTLIKAIQNRMTDTSLLRSFTEQFRKVSGVESHTAGIIPVSIQSKKLGDMIMYDFAGQYEYYSSHAALLENLVSTPAAMVMVVVDLSKNREEIIQTLHYWNSFIENHCSQEEEKPHVLIVGSHADVVKFQGDNPEKKASEIMSAFKLSSCFQSSTFVTLDCTRLASTGLANISDTIAQSCRDFQHKFEDDLQLHFLHSFLSQKFEKVTACRVSDILSHIAQEENPDVRVGDEILTLLPADLPTLTEHLDTLTDNGQLLYLENKENIKDSWVILSKEVLLSEVNGTIFAPENFKEHHNIASSTGVAPLFMITRTFHKHDPEMITGFLTHYELCQPIAESEAALISGVPSNARNTSTYYFFPALISEQRPEESSKSIEQTHYRCGWVLRCSRPDQFLLPRFLHVLLLRLVFSFALNHDTADKDTACPVLQRKCNVWKGGIHWQNRSGVEAIVEVVEQNTAVVVMMGCLEGREMACVNLRSEVIRTILETKKEKCSAVETRESFIHPAELTSYPLKSPQLLTSFTITELASVIKEDSPVVTTKQGHRHEMLKIEELHYFEPYANFKAELVAQLFDKNNTDRDVPESFLHDLSRAAYKKMELLKESLTFSETELHAQIAGAPQDLRDSAIHQCFLVFKTWSVCAEKPTYKALRCALDKFSVFCGRNPLALSESSK